MKTVSLLKYKFHLVIASFLLCSTTAIAAPICQSADSDPDGDGWGWENYQSCQSNKTSQNSVSQKSFLRKQNKTTKPDNTARHPTCTRNAQFNGDGWGWENFSPCLDRNNQAGSKVSSSAANENKDSFPNSPTCTSKATLNGDGWGWENNRSCRVRNSRTSNVSLSVKTAISSQTSTDTEDEYSDVPTCSSKAILSEYGWGWDNNASCRVRTDVAIDSTPAFKAATSSTTRSVVEVEPPKTSAKIAAPRKYDGVTAFEEYGKLSVCGTKICNSKGEVVQLTGMSSHGLHWFPWDTCLTTETMDMLAYDWKTDIFRIAMYVSGGKPWLQQYAYTDNPQLNIDQVNKYIDEVSKRGMYALVDFHVLSENPRRLYTEHAKRFFKDIVEDNKHRDNIIYEIANEPTNTTWSEIVEYANEVIPVIRGIDPDAIIIVGTRQWSSFNHGDYMEVVNNQIKADNIMYAFHAYAPDKNHQQKYIDVLVNASKLIPVFVSEWGSTEASGQHNHDDYWSQKYVDVMKEHNIGWAFWNFSSDQGGSSIWKSEYCGQDNKDWSDSNMKESGRFIKRVFTGK